MAFLMSQLLTLLPVYHLFFHTSHTSTLNIVTAGFSQSLISICQTTWYPQKTIFCKISDQLLEDNPVFQSYMNVVTAIHITYQLISEDKLDNWQRVENSDSEEVPEIHLWFLAQNSWILACHIHQSQEGFCSVKWHKNIITSEHAPYKHKFKYIIVYLSVTPSWTVLFNTITHSKIPS